MIPITYLGAIRTRPILPSLHRVRPLRRERQLDIWASLTERRFRREGIVPRYSIYHDRRGTVRYRGGYRVLSNT